MELQLVPQGGPSLCFFFLQVANGYRPPLKPHVPASVQALIDKCWKGRPELRPTMGQVAAELRSIQLAGAAVM